MNSNLYISQLLLRNFQQNLVVKRNFISIYIHAKSGKLITMPFVARPNLRSAGTVRAKLYFKLVSGTCVYIYIHICQRQAYCTFEKKVPVFTNTGGQLLKHEFNSDKKQGIVCEELI